MGDDNIREACDIPKIALRPGPLRPVPPKSRARVRPNAPPVASESISDSADFIRSTGPPQSFAVEPPRQTNTSVHRIIAPYLPIIAAKSRAVTGSLNRLQARDAVVYGDNLSSSELTDFIRQGPPSEKGHRIRRTVALFRTAMYSGEIQPRSPVTASRLS
jgi:hypothetical protein